MVVLAVCSLAPEFAKFTSFDVELMWDSFEVIGVDALVISTFVVDFTVGRYGSGCNFIGVPMSAPDSTVPIELTVVSGTPGGDPDPTSGVWLWDEFANESVEEHGEDLTHEGAAV